MNLFKTTAVAILFIFSANAANAQEVLKTRQIEENTVLKQADPSPKPMEQSTIDEKQTWERSRNPNYKEPQPAVKKEEEKAITEKSKNPQ